MKENEIVVSVKEWNRLLKEADYWRTMYEGCKKRKDVSLEWLEKEIDVVLADACKGETTEANKKSYSVFATALKGHFRIKAKKQAGEK